MGAVGQRLLLAFQALRSFIPLVAKGELWRGIGAVEREWGRRTVNGNLPWIPGRAAAGLRGLLPFLLLGVGTPSWQPWQMKEILLPS